MARRPLRPDKVATQGVQGILPSLSSAVIRYLLEGFKH